MRLMIQKENTKSFKEECPPENGRYVDEEGNVYWYKQGVFHHETLPAVEFSWNEQRWYQEGVLHRIGGPAIIKENGNQLWYQQGLKHRLDGPAVEAKNNYKEWWIEDVRYTEEDFIKTVQSIELKKKLQSNLKVNKPQSKNKI